MPDKHDIKTYGDILRAVNADNLENFLIDFRSALEYWVAVKGIVEAASPETLEQTINTATLKWIDDGKHDKKINIDVVA
jgi:hypothetical protein